MEEEYRGYAVLLEQDSEPLDPRIDYDNVSEMACWHGRYRLGDRSPVGRPTNTYPWRSPAEWLRAVLCDAGEDEEELGELSVGELEGRLGRHYLWLPLYLYDHSGITMSTYPFSDPWDSGRVGLILVSFEKAAQEWGGTADNLDVPYGPIPERTVREQAYEYLRSEVRGYDAFIRGDVVVCSAEDPDGEVVYCVGGYFPDENGKYEDALADARAAVDADIEKREEGQLALEKSLSTAGAGI